MKMDSSIFTKMLKYIKHDANLENMYLLEILGTALFKDRAFCESLLYSVGVEEVDKPEMIQDGNCIYIKQGKEWFVVLKSYLTDSDGAEEKLSTSECSLNVIVELGHEPLVVASDNDKLNTVGLSYKELALMIDETCSDMTIELHQFLIENYLIKELELG